MNEPLPTTEALQKFKDYIVRRGAASSRKPGSSDYFYASMVGNCTRELMYQYTGLGVKTRGTYLTYMPMLLGTELHKLMQRKWLPAAGVEILNPEDKVRKTYKTRGAGTEVSFVGHTDGTFLGRSGDITWDLKTFGDYRFKQWKIGGLQHWERFKKEHLQTTLYADALGVNEIEVWGMNRASGQIIPFKFTRTGEALDHLHDRIDEIGIALDLMGTSPEEGDLPPREYEPNDIECMICSFRFQCHGKAARSLPGR